MFELEPQAAAAVAPSASSASVGVAASVSGSTLTAEVVTTHAAAQVLRAEWRALVDECGARNPFVDPTWVLTWAEHFVADGDLFIVAVRERGNLCCVAPFYRRTIGRGPIRLARTIQLVGAVEHVVLTDRPQILARPTHTRRALRRVLEVLQAERDWDWVEVSITARQGWFEPAWIDPSAPAQAFVVHKTSRPSVGFALPATEAALRAGLKRNLRESLRRARNRLARTGRDWRIEIVSEPSDFRDAIEALMELHGARSSMAGKIAHADMFTTCADREFVIDVLMRLAGEGNAEAFFVVVDGRRVAGLMTLLAPDAVSFCFSGVDPEWWAFSAVTLLHWEAARRAVAAGRTFVDPSAGIDVAKLRWSEAVEIHPEFIVVSGRRRSQAAFGAYFLASAAARAGRERARFRRLPAGDQ